MIPLSSTTIEPFGGSEARCMLSSQYSVVCVVRTGTFPSIGAQI